MKILYNFLTMKEKYFDKSRVLEPFISIITGVIDIVLLPTPFVCNLHTKWLKHTVKRQMAKRIKNHI